MQGLIQKINHIQTLIIWKDRDKCLNNKIINEKNNSLKLDVQLSIVVCIPSHNESLQFLL